MKENRYLVFDIETVGLPWECFDEAQKEYLLRNASTEEEQEKKVRELALSPLCAQIACIGLRCIQEEGEKNTTLWESALVIDSTMTDGEKRKENLSDGAVLTFCNEITLLQSFWNIFTKYPGLHLISFNGRGFDAPFLMLRSAVQRIRPTRNLMDGTKWNYPLHTDLQDELAFYGFQTSGPMRRFNFDFYARTFGITSPKAHGIDGSKVGEFFHEGRLAEIAEYCLRDVHATWELFLFWRRYLSMK